MTPDYHEQAHEVCWCCCESICMHTKPGALPCISCKNIALALQTAFNAGAKSKITLDYSDKTIMLAKISRLEADRARLWVALKNLVSNMEDSMGI